VSRETPLDAFCAEEADEVFQFGPGTVCAYRIAAQ
jgi:hypothetical protein